jgi:HK97 family phage major capsid protein
MKHTRPGLSALAGQVIGYRKNGQPIRLAAGGAPTLDELRTKCEEAPTGENLNELRESIENELRTLNDEAGSQALTSEQDERWQMLDEEHRQTVERLHVAERRAKLKESRERWGSTRFSKKVETPAQSGNIRGLSPQELRSKALTVLDDDESVMHLRDDAKQRTSDLIRSATRDTNGALVAARTILTENPHYRSAFMKLVTSPTPVLTPEEGRALQAFEEFRAMSIGTDGSGGFGVPVLIDPTIILTAQGHPSDILGLARVETITTDVWKGVSSAGVTWKFRAEATATTDGSPTLAQPSVTTHKCDGYIPYSIEVGMDYPGFAMEMEGLLSSGYAELLVQKLSVGAGDGSNEPFGIITALDANTNVEVATTTAGTIGAADINGLWAALPIRYRNPALAGRVAWMSHTGVNGDIQQLGQDAGSAFTVNFTAEGVTQLKGRAMYENDYFADLPAGTTAANLLVVGDWRNFVVAQRAGMNIELVPHVFDVTNNRPTGERAWYAWARVGSDSVNDLAFRMLQNKTS